MTSSPELSASSRKPAATSSDDAPTLPKSLPSLTGLRFVAAFSVFCYHSTQVTSFLPDAGQVSPFANLEAAYGLEFLFSRAGFFGVGFFFVLSGFVIAWGWRGGETRPFWRRRLVKIYPNHVAIWLLAMVLYASAISPWGGAAANLLLLNAFSPDTVQVPINPPSWTLGAELVFYLTFPLVASALFRLSRRALAWLATAMVSLAVAVPFIAMTALPGPPPNSMAPVSELQLWFAYMFPVARLPEFVLGATLALLVRNGWRPRIPVSLAWIVLGVTYVVATLVLPFQFSFAVAGLLPICLLVIAYAVRDCAGKRSWLQRPTWQRLGEISYGFYLCQSLTVFYVRDQVGSPTYEGAMGFAVIGGLFVLTLLGGWALWAGVERPAMRRWSRSPSRAAAPSGR